MAQDKPNKIVRAVKEVARNLNVAGAARKAKEIVDEEAPRPAPEQDTDDPAVKA